MLERERARERDREIEREREREKGQPERKEILHFAKKNSSKFPSKSCRSVIRIGKILLLWQKFNSLGQFCKGLLCVWQNFEPTLAIFYGIG